MKTVILAAGQASRLGKLAKNIPKCLVSFGGKPAIDHLLSKLPQTNNICVCVSDDFRGELLQNYLERPGIRFVTQKLPIGTSNAVSLCLEPDDDVLISWSDIIPKSNIAIPKVSSIFTTNDFSCRYRFDGDKIEQADGNIIGMFYLTKNDVSIIDSLLHVMPNSDFVDVLKASELEFNNVTVECFDFGTPKTFVQTSESLNTSPYANIERDGSLVTKRYNELGSDLFEKESLWYSFVPSSVKRFIPRIHYLSNNAITMDYIDAQPVDSDDEMKDFLARAIYELDEYFHSNKYPSHREALYNEYIDVPLQRCEAVCKFVPELNNKEININGNLYENPVYTLKHTGDKIIELLMPNKFSFIHGDPTLQNMMYSNGKILFIDPKAKFGNIWLYGDSKYDFAKLYYSFVGGYENFNSGKYELDVNPFIYSIVKPRFYQLSGWYLNYLNNKLAINPNDIKLIHAIIWLRAVGYVLPRSIEQSIVAFLNGTVLFNEAIK